MQLKTAKFTEKKSKFFGFLFSVKSQEEADEIVGRLSKEHRKANHVCAGILLGREERYKNDGEVGYPGKTLLGLLKHQGLDSHMIVVVRYFGGVKLGPGGVSRAFKSCGKMLL